MCADGEPMHTEDGGGKTMQADRRVGIRRMMVPTSRKRWSGVRGAFYWPSLMDRGHRLSTGHHRWSGVSTSITDGNGAFYWPYQMVRGQRCILLAIPDGQGSKVLSIGHTRWSGVSTSHH